MWYDVMCCDERRVQAGGEGELDVCLRVYPAALARFAM